MAFCKNLQLEVAVQVAERSSRWRLELFCSFLQESVGREWNHSLLAKNISGCSGCISLLEAVGGGGSASCWKWLEAEVLAVALCKNLKVKVAVQVPSRGCRCAFGMSLSG